MAVASGAVAATPVAEPVVQLPPMTVTESANLRPWLYVRTAEREYLSRCPPRLTRDFVEAQQRVMQVLRVIVPETFLARSDVPAISILVDDASTRTGNDVVAEELRRATPSPAPRPLVGLPEQRSGAAAGPVQFLSNLRLDDSDMTVFFAVLKAEDFDGERLWTTPTALRSMLERRTPMLPPWLVEGVVAVYRQMTLAGDAIVLPPLIWVSAEESQGLIDNPERPRVLLPLNEFFSPDALRDGDGNELRQRAWRAQCALFFRWAIDPANRPAREAFWKLAERAGSERVTEEIFEACFGFGFSDLRDRLSEYLPQAVRASFGIDVGKLPPISRVEARPATRGEIARLRGEWERVEIGYVQGTHPEFTARYIAQARRTLRRALDEGETDPRLKAALGLCELDAGDETAARPLLEAALAAGVVRPRVCYEIARLRLADLIRGQPARELTAGEIAPVVEPLRIGAGQAPALPETFALFADAWLRSKDVPPAGDFALLAQAANLFSWRPALNYRIALLQARHGRRSEAAKAIANGLACAADHPTRARFIQLQTLLAAPRKP